MIESTFGFRLNKVSFEGAGKTYEVLAKNAGQKAAAAGQASSAAMSEYTRSIGLFNRYFQASQNTNQAANQTASRANEALNQGRAGLSQAGQAQLALNLQRKRDVVGAVNELNSAGKTFAATVQQAKLQEGLVEGMRMGGEIDNIADPHEKLQKIEGFMDMYEEDPQDARMQGISRTVFPMYSGAVEEADIKRREVLIRSAITLADNSLAQSGNDLKINMDEMAKYAKDKNIPMGEVRDAVYATVGAQYAEQITQANTPQALQEAIQEWGTIVENNFNNEFFIKSKNTTTQHLLTKIDRKLKDAVTFSQKKIKLQGEDRWNKIKANPAIHTKEQVQSTLDWMQLKPLERQNKLNDYSTLHADQAKDQYFRSEFKDVSVPMGEMWKHAPKTTVRNAELAIGAAGFKAFMSGGTARFQEILEANPGHVSEIGVNIGKAFDGGTTIEKGAIYGQLIKVRNTTTASQGLSQTLPDGDLARILTTGALAKAMPAQTQEQADKNWEKATQMLSNDAGSVPIELNPMTDRDLYNNMMEDAVTMGNNAGRFIQTVKKVYSKNPDQGNAQYDYLEEYFSNLNETTNVTIGFTDKQITEDKGHAPDHFANPKTGVQAEYIEEAKSKMLSEVALDYYNKNGYEPNIMSMTYMANGIVGLNDEFGNTITYAPVQKFIENFRQGKFDLEQLQAEAEKASMKRVKGVEGKDVLNNLANDFAQWIEGGAN